MLVVRDGNGHLLVPCFSVLCLVGGFNIHQGIIGAFVDQVIFIGSWLVYRFAKIIIFHVRVIPKIHFSESSSSVTKWSHVYSGIAAKRLGSTGLFYFLSRHPWAWEGRGLLPSSSGNIRQQVGVQDFNLPPHCSCRGVLTQEATQLAQPNVPPASTCALFSVVHRDYLCRAT